VASLARKTAQQKISVRIDIKPSVAAHETFHPRSGWLKKAYEATSDDPLVFLRPDAATKLGVGKNMVRAIRFWGEAFKILDRFPSQERPRQFESRPTALGKQLLDNNGWDPFLEDPVSLWLLHWKLLETPCLAPSWYIALANPSGLIIDSDVLMKRVSEALNADWGLENTAENSLTKDVRCILRMYAAVGEKRDLLEDSIDSPFSSLGLLRESSSAAGSFVFNEGEKRGLTSELITYTCLSYLADSTSITLDRLAGEPGAPGLVFRIGTEAIGRAIDYCASRHSWFRLVESTSGKMLIREHQDGVGPSAVISTAYEAEASKSLTRFAVAR
jgi:hypothetical protein